MNQTDKRAFEAKLDEYVQRYVEALDATDGVGTEEAKQARAAVLAAYYAGREGQPVSSIDYWQKRGHHVCPECNGTRVRSYRQADHLGGQYVDVPCECTHPAPKADAAADCPTIHQVAQAIGNHITAYRTNPMKAIRELRGPHDVREVLREKFPTWESAASPARGGEGEKDAARYRFIRSGDSHIHSIYFQSFGEEFKLIDTDLDESVDAAMSREAQ